LGAELKPTSAFILSLIGGISEIIAGIISGLIAVMSPSSPTSVAEILGFLSLWWLIGGMIIVMLAILLYRGYSNRKQLSVTIIILSAFSLFNIIGVIGGVLVYPRKPKVR